MAPTRTTRSQVKEEASPAVLRPMDRSPIKRRRGGLTQAQKQALIDNLQLEITERARRLRAQYNIQAQSLRSRIEIRVNRIPLALRHLTIGQILERYAQQEQKQKEQQQKLQQQLRHRVADRENAPRHVPRDEAPPKKAAPETTRRTKASTQETKETTKDANTKEAHTKTQKNASTTSRSGPLRDLAARLSPVKSQTRSQKRISDESIRDKENNLDALENPKKRRAVLGTTDSTMAHVLSPTSANPRSRRHPVPVVSSPGKAAASRQASPAKLSSASRGHGGAARMLSSMVEKAKATRNVLGSARKAALNTSTTSAASTSSSQSSTSTRGSTASRPTKRGGVAGVSAGTSTPLAPSRTPAPDSRSRRTSASSTASSSTVIRKHATTKKSKASTNSVNATQGGRVRKIGATPATGSVPSTPIVKETRTRALRTRKN